MRARGAGAHVGRRPLGRYWQAGAWYVPGVGGVAPGSGSVRCCGCLVARGGVCAGGFVLLTSLLGSR